MKQKLINWLTKNLGISEIIKRQDQIEEKQAEHRADHLRLVQEVRNGQDKNKRKTISSSQAYRNGSNDKY